MNARTHSDRRTTPGAGGRERWAELIEDDGAGIDGDIERLIAVYQTKYIIPPKSLRDPRRNVPQAYDIIEESASRISEASKVASLRISGLSTHD
jgi:hypothetical protein